MLDFLGREMDFLNFDVQRQQVPNLYFKIFRIQPSQQSSRLTWTLPLDKGYGFLLRRLGGQYALQDDAAPFVAVLPPHVKIQLYDTKRGRTWQNEAYPLRLVLTPADQGYTTTQPAPVDTDLWSIGFQDKPVKNKITYNNYYAYRQTIKVDITFASTPVMALFMHLTLILDGYLIPELGLEQWQ